MTPTGATRRGAFVMDASAWLAAVDTADRWHEAARELIRAHPVLALDLTLYEVANVAVRAWRAPELARGLVELVLGASVGIPVAASASLLRAAIALADEHRITVYDASYAAAAQELGCELVSCDERDLVRTGLAISPDDAINR